MILQILLLLPVFPNIMHNVACEKRCTTLSDKQCLKDINPMLFLIETCDVINPINLI